MEIPYLGSDTRSYFETFIRIQKQEKILDNISHIQLKKLSRILEMVLQSI